VVNKRLGAIYIHLGEVKAWCMQNVDECCKERPILRSDSNVSWPTWMPLTSCIKPTYESQQIQRSIIMEFVLLKKNDAM
jgi:hypothetical protein